MIMRIYKLVVITDLIILTETLVYKHFVRSLFISIASFIHIINILLNNMISRIVNS